MLSSSQPHYRMKSKDNCGVCGSALIYGTESAPINCSLCGKAFNALIYCPKGHYICDACHQQETINILKNAVVTSLFKNPQEIFESIVANPSIPMHGPDHHAIVPAVIVAAVKNAGYLVPEGALEKAIARGGSVPGGWCGSHGSCGAGIGVGIAVSVLTGATPLTGKERALANEATVFALSRMVDGYPRCCKRAGRKAIDAAVDFLRTNLNIELQRSPPVICGYVDRNQQCPKEGCIYYKGR
jgi:hypothetical protein